MRPETYFLDGLVGVEVVERFEEEFGVTITDTEAVAMKTLDDIVTRIWWKVSIEPGKGSRVA
jgi:acyl carrier protein